MPSQHNVGGGAMSERAQLYYGETPVPYASMWTAEQGSDHVALRDRMAEINDEIARRKRSA